ncbi:TatD family hydrolase [Neobacillus sp. SM06]|uniref:TatD family hydrolase n=1 Tax=Neobacillus sp. SM06 TaxID=3422492 RepID=UPI003D2C503E
MFNLIDAHIHLDQYHDDEIQSILNDSLGIDFLITVSTDLNSCRRNLQLSKIFQKVKPSFGYHPEQPLPSDTEKQDLIDWIENHLENMTAVGEVGLPYYLKKEGKVSVRQYEEYREWLSVFIQLAKKWKTPIALHAVYEDASVVCDLLEKYSFVNAHFHWYKGDAKTTERMIENGYFISVTPEVVYKSKIQTITKMYPIEQIMVETDGPWPFEGPFKGKRTQPGMMQQAVKSIAEIKMLSEEKTARMLHQNTMKFYRL